MQQPTFAPDRRNSVENTTLVSMYLQGKPRKMDSFSRRAAEMAQCSEYEPRHRGFFANAVLYVVG